MIFALCVNVSKDELNLLYSGKNGVNVYANVYYIYGGSKSELQI